MRDAWAMAAGGSGDAGKPYQVVARRFRPQSFQELVGQDDVLASLRLALQQHKVPHAFLFSGSRGVGKTTSARILARCLNCLQGPTPTPCGECAACTAILEGSSPDVIEIDAASNNSVEDVRQLREHVAYATMGARYRVVILDEVHMLSKGAFNALLKTLEEPPPQVVFVLATTELHKVPETIVSRCQVLLFRRVGDSDLMRRLRMIADREGVHVPDEVLQDIALSVRGGVRDAETALERLLPLARELGTGFDLAAYRTVVVKVGLDRAAEVVEALLGGDVRQGLQFAREQQERGTNEYEALGELVDVLRYTLLLKADGPDSGLVPVSGTLRERLVQLAGRVALHQLDAMLSAGIKGRARLRHSDDRGAILELALVRMAQAGSLPTLADLLAEVRAGGGGGGGGGGGSAAPAASARPMFGAGAGPAAGGAARSAPAATAAAPAAPRAAAPVGADLKSQLLAAMHDRGLLKATLGVCRVLGPDADGKVTIVPETDRKMHLDRLASPEVQRETTQFVQTVLGKPVPVVFRLAEAKPAGPAPVPAAEVQPGPAAKLALATFHGRVVAVNPEDRVRLEPPAPAEGDVEGPGEDLLPSPDD